MLSLARAPERPIVMMTPWWLMDVVGMMVMMLVVLE